MTLLCFWVFYKYQQIFFVDVFLNVLFTFLIIEGVWNLLQRNLKIILQVSLPEIDLEKIQREFLFIDSVISTHKFHFWLINLNHY